MLNNTIKEIQIKTTVRYQLTTIKMSSIKNKANKTKQKIMSIDEDVEKLESSCTFGENLKWCCNDRKQYSGSSKILK